MNVSFRTNQFHTVSLVITLVAWVVGSPIQAQDRSLIRVCPECGQKQVALVIGNSEYKVKPLVNPSNDAQDVGARLKQLGYDTDIVLDADRRRMREAINEFLKRIHPGDIALFYYAGHGIQFEDHNYLIPVDYDGQREEDVKYEAEAVDRIQESMEHAGTQLNVLILDACRNNPYRASSRGGTGGLAGVPQVMGTYVAFATAPGKTASDNGSDRNGLFTKNLLEALQQPGLSLKDLFDQVRLKVYENSSQKQFPWYQDGVIGKYYFIPPSPSDRVAGPLPPPQTGSPQIKELKPDRLTMEPGESQDLHALASDPDSRPLEFEWAATGGTIEPKGDTARFTAGAIQPGSAEGVITISVTARNDRGLTSARELVIRVRPPEKPALTQGRTMMYGTFVDVWLEAGKPSGAAGPGTIEAALDKSEGVWQVTRVQGSFPGTPVQVAPECRTNCTVISILEEPGPANGFLRMRLRVQPTASKQSMSLRLQYQPQTGKRKK